MSGRILIVDDVPTNRALLKAKLTTAYFDVTTVDSASDIFEITARLEPDLILIDLTRPDQCGYALCRKLKAGSETFHIPVVMITDADKTGQRLKGLEAGADDFINKPYDECTLIARVRSLMRLKIMFDEMRLRDDTSRELGLNSFLQDVPAMEAMSGGVLIAGPDATSSNAWAEALSHNTNLQISGALSEAEAVELAHVAKPDLVIIHSQLSDKSDGLAVLSALKTEKHTRQSAVIFVVEAGDEARAASAIDLGATDYLVSPFDPNELMVRVRSQLRRKQYLDRLRTNVVDGLKMAVIDPLTGLYNRRYALQHLATIANRAEAEGAPFSILMMDLDEFKCVNDRHGHAAGDEVLCEFSRRLQENVRGIDLVARIGGEEFFVAMPGTDTDQAALVAERLREAMETRPFVLGGIAAPVNVTVSIGVAASTDGNISSAQVLKNADDALYEAKDEGRNAVKIHDNAA